MKPAAETARAVAADWLRPRLAAATGQVVGVGRHAAYVRMDGRRGDGDWMLAVEGPGGVGLPCGLRLGAPDARLLEQLDTGQVVVGTPRGVRVAGDRHAAGGLDVHVVRWHRARPVVEPSATATLRRRIAALVGPGARVPWWDDAWHDLDPVMGRGASDLAGLVAGTTPSGDGPSIADRLLGHGPGSTPSGDDLLAAVVATTTVLDPAATSRLTPMVAHLSAHAHLRTTLLSATLLACAVDGAMVVPAAGFLHLLVGDVDPGDRLVAALGHLQRVGHTSGHDLALGILVATGAVAMHPGAVDAPAPETPDTAIGPRTTP